MNIISSIQNSLLGQDDTQKKKDEPTNDVKIETTFKLPIEYLDSNHIKPLSSIISNDLELLHCDENQSQSQSVYEASMHPTNCFAKQMLSKWNVAYTTDTVFLKDTQKVIEKMQLHKQNISIVDKNFDIEDILPIWKNTKQNSFFHEKYNYLDWDILKHLNESESFLQILSCIHLLSPVISFVLPIFILIFPFIILKIQGIPITVSIYIETLKSIAKNHTIGKILFNIGSLDWDKLIYLCFTLGLYIFQIYQNVNLCKRFYSNIINVNNDLLFLKKYIQYSIDSMTSMKSIVGDFDTYSKFNVDLCHHIETLENLNKDICRITEFKHSIGKAYDIGYMLKLYYIIHVNKSYEHSLQYSVGFNGYVDNLSQIHACICDGTMSFATFSSKNECQFDNQYYPIITSDKLVKNNVNMKKNMIISAPNKAGKTTFIKTTLINIIFTQQFGCGFYSSAKLKPYSHIHSYLNIPDTSGRDSLFQAESRRCKEIIDTINENKDSTDRHFCIFDELYSGTNPDEAVKSGHAFLKYLESFENVDFILTTHYKQICKKFKDSNHVCNYKMLVNVDENDNFDYTYKITKGISSIKGGVRVLKDMHYPDEIINNIENN